MHSKTTGIWLMATGLTLLISGCAALNPKPVWGPHCPEPEHKEGYLILEKGKTRKCHVQVYSRNCRGITDSTGANGLVCGYAQGTTLYLFDKQDVLQNYRTFTRPAPKNPK